MSVSISTTVYNWLRELKIPVSENYIRHQLNAHPDYPSLLSITDTLNRLGIENTAVQIEKEQLNELNYPFIAHVRNRGVDFIKISDGRRAEELVPGFFNKWDGVVIAAEKPENWKHKLNAEWLLKDRRKSNAVSGTLSALLLFVFLSGVFSFSWQQAALLLIAIAGLFISWMIVTKDLGIENKIADELCGADADCNSVIHSNASKFSVGTGWSDAGIIYFSFLFLVLTVTGLMQQLAGILPLLSIIAATALPVTIFSVYYQWRVIKKWCRLCLVTVALLWLQFLVLVPVNGFRVNETGISSIVLTAFLLFISAAAWLWLKPFIKAYRKMETENFALLRFKNTPEIFEAVLAKQRRLTVNPEGLGITLGNPAAANTIIKVCNPYCGPCAKAHAVIDKVLGENDNLRVQVLFTASDDENDRKAKPVKHLMALFEKNDEQIIKKALDDWYLNDKKDYEAFAANYVLNGELEKQGGKLKAMKKWCDEMKIEFTPTFFVNGYQLPKHYNIDELKYFLS